MISEYVTMEEMYYTQTHQNKSINGASTYCKLNNFFLHAPYQNSDLMISWKIILHTAYTIHKTFQTFKAYAHTMGIQKYTKT